MAQITIEIPNEHVPRIKAAYVLQLAESGNLEPSNEDTLEAIKQEMKNMLKSKVRRTEVSNAKNTAIQSIEPFDL